MGRAAPLRVPGLSDLVLYKGMQRDIKDIKGREGLARDVMGVQGRCRTGAGAADVCVRRDGLGVGACARESDV